MLVLLPPSEGKTTPSRGPRLEIASLSFPDLNPAREEIVRQLISWSTDSPKDVQRALGLSDRQLGEVERNQALATSPCAPAAAVYTGVLYEALSWPTTTAAQRRRGQCRLAISSALCGLLRPLDLIPAYRLSAGTRMPDLPGLTSIWQDGIANICTTLRRNQIIVDLRSAAYVKLAPIPPALSERTVSVRVLAQRGKKRVVVSHHNKATKGQLARDLIDIDIPRSTQELAQALNTIGYTVELTPPAKAGPSWGLDIITRE